MGKHPETCNLQFSAFTSKMLKQGKIHKEMKPMDWLKMRTNAPNNCLHLFRDVVVGCRGSSECILKSSLLVISHCEETLMTI